MGTTIAKDWPRESALPKQPGEGAERFAAVAACVLFLGGKLGGGLFEAGGLEDGVVAESARATRRGQYATFPRAVRDERGRVVGAAREGDDALISRCAPLGRHIAKLVEHLLQVGTIRRALASVARRVDAGAAIQRIDFDAGVVGERG